MVKNIAEILTKIATVQSWNYSLYNTPLTYEEIFSAKGLLPIFTKVANQNSLTALGYGIGVSYEEDDDAILGKVVRFDEVTPNTLKLLFLYDVLLELANQQENGVIKLDDLTYNLP